MVSDNDDVISTNSNYNQEFKSGNQQQHAKSTKTTRSGLFTSSIFTRVRNVLIFVYTCAGLTANSYFIVCLYSE